MVSVTKETRLSSRSEEYREMFNKRELKIFPDKEHIPLVLAEKIGTYLSERLHLTIF